MENENSPMKDEEIDIGDSEYVDESNEGEVPILNPFLTQDELSKNRRFKCIDCSHKFFVTTVSGAPNCRLDCPQCGNAITQKMRTISRRAWVAGYVRSNEELIQY